eukprot:CAMPEP_0194483936 /NCGR_PEP_ID=MMETSP0253-20130528/5423_1 /TAXON_ID=2966 /ORGANISM="Noctiluca scintillans" /LENGTH=629 /DNA_ID=CAMNT_0039323669 /DNA_START=36 /DNA_END=1925 /DNA_ORIENTATION=+
MPKIPLHHFVALVFGCRSGALAFLQDAGDVFLSCDSVTFLQVYNAIPPQIEADELVASAPLRQSTTVLAHRRDDDGRGLTDATHKLHDVIGVAQNKSEVQVTTDSASSLDAVPLAAVTNFVVRGTVARQSHGAQFLPSQASSDRDDLEIEEGDEVGKHSVDIDDLRSLSAQQQREDGEPGVQNNIWELHRSPAECVLFALSFVALCTFGGWCLDRSLVATESDKPPWWVILMTFSSYLFVVPGLFVLAFEGSFFATVYVSETDPIPVRMWQGRDSLLTVITTLFRKKKIITGNLCVLYGILVPVVKLALITVLLVTSSDRRRIRSGATFWVKFLSKWDSPKIFSYMAMWIITIAFNNPPKVETHMTLGGGFLLYMVYCIGTLFAAVGLPDIANDPSERFYQPWAIRTFGERGLVTCAVGSTVLFSILFFMGAVTPLMTLDFLPEDGHFIPPVAYVLTELAVPTVKVNFFDCLSLMYNYLAISGVTIFVMFTTLLFLFVWIFTFVHVIGIAVATVMLTYCTRGDTAYLRPLRRLSWLCKQLHLLAMLDVFIMGLSVGVLSVSGCFIDGGLSVKCDYGICFLVAAEVVRWLQEMTLGDAVHFSAQRFTEGKMIRITDDVVAVQQTPRARSP